MRKGIEKDVQEGTKRWLVSNNIYPFSVIYTLAQNTDGLVAITTYLKKDLIDLLELLDYKSQCDKTGYTVFEKNNTVVLSGLALINLYSKSYV